MEVVEKEGEEPQQQQMVLHRTPSVIRAAEVAQIPNVPVILFMGKSEFYLISYPTENYYLIKNIMTSKSFAHRYNFTEER